MGRPNSMVAIAAILPVVAGLVGAGAALARETVIGQKNRSFKPGSVELAVGDTVQFTNEDIFLHHVSVKSDTFTFDSGEQEPGQTVAIKFTQAGTFEVACAIHPKMRLQVTVR